jgi:hypothetical protein
MRIRISTAYKSCFCDGETVSALNSLFEQWDTQAVELWNLSGEPCSGSAIDQTDFEDPDNNPAIKCECTQTTCHITQLYVSLSRFFFLIISTFSMTLQKIHRLFSYILICI